MNTERTQVGWRFWLWWMLATAVVPSVVTNILFVFSESLPESDPQQRLGAALLGIPLVLATFIIAQWLVLRRQIPRAGSWVVAGIVALVVSLVVGIVAGGVAGFLLAAMGMEILGADSAFGVGLAVSTFVGIPLALATFIIAQWLVLRRHVSRAGLWLLVPIVSIVVTAVVASVVDLVVGGAAGEVVCIPVYGAVTGGVLVWLLRQPGERA